MAQPLSPRDAFVRAEIARLGPLRAFQELIAESDRLILGPELDNGCELVKDRCAIYRMLMADWAEEQRQIEGYDRPFAVVALGGTGREEMTPYSDTDFAFLFDDVIEGNAFLAKLQDQVLHSNVFRERCGFRGEVLPFNLDDMPELEDKQLNAFVDLNPVYDPERLADRFRDRIRETYDPFEHFLHVSRFWRDHWGENTSQSERLDQFDIKNDGLRIFLAGIWALAGKEFRHCHEIYEQLEDPRDLESYHFLLRIRSFVHLRRGQLKSGKAAPGDHAEDVLDFEEFISFGEMLGAGARDREKFEFGNLVRERLLAARRRVDRFTWGVIGRELKEGRIIRPGSAILYGSGGLRDSAVGERKGNRAKSRAALGVLLASQRYGLPIDPAEMETTFRDAGDWMEPVPELGQLFYESRGSLADSLRFLSQLPGTEERLFPGYARFEASLDERVMTERRFLRGPLLRRKIRALESDLREGVMLIEQARDPDALADSVYEVSIPIESALLDSDHLAAVRLALKTKRLPETPLDIAARNDPSLPLHDRFSGGISGIPLSEYYLRNFSGCGFTDEALALTEFLVENRRVFKELADEDLMDDIQVDKLLECCGGDEMRLRALFVFVCADRTEWESEEDEPVRWFNIRELYGKAQMRFRPGADPTHKLTVAGYSPDELEVLKDFGGDFYSGIYRHNAIRFGGYLLRLKENPEQPPRVTRIRVANSDILAVAAHDHPGIAASISGAFWRHRAGLRQAHLFSSARHGLALDFFHLGPLPTESETELDQTTPLSDLSRAIGEAIREEQFIGPDDEAGLPDIAENVRLEKSASGLCHLRAETRGDVGALIYVLTCKAFRRLGANIYGLAAHTGRDQARASVYLGLPETMRLAEAREIVKTWER